MRNTQESLLPIVFPIGKSYAGRARLRQYRENHRLGSSLQYRPHGNSGHSSCAIIFPQAPAGIALFLSVPRPTSRADAESPISTHNGQVSDPSLDLQGGEVRLFYETDFREREPLNIECQWIFGLKPSRRFSGCNAEYKQRQRGARYDAASVIP